MAMIGMDVEAVKSLASRMSVTADEIESTVRNLTSQLQGTEWRGPDRLTFENDWGSSASQQLTRIAAQLRETSQHLQREAAQQQSASA